MKSETNHFYFQDIWKRHKFIVQNALLMSGNNMHDQFNFYQGYSKADICMKLV